MTEHLGISILQYNTHNSKDVIFPLIADPETRNFDFIAVQEPWKSPGIMTSHNPSTSGFYLAYQETEDVNVCWYINKRIDPQSWEVNYWSKNLATLKIKVAAPASQSGAMGAEREVWLHNVYNQDPGNRIAANLESTDILPAIRGALSTITAVEHILLGDFNLHHPAWNNEGRMTHDDQADTLLEITRTRSLELTSLSRKPTWRARGLESTIDLVFMSQTLLDQLIKCDVDDNWDHGSDHLPIATMLSFEIDQELPKQHRAWKTANPEKVKEAAKKHVPVIPVLESKEQIDQFVGEIEACMYRVIEETVPLQKISAKAQSFWTPECGEAVRLARNLRRRLATNRDEDGEEQYRKALRAKSKIIKKTKALHFRQEIHDAATSPEGIWKLSKWAKDRSHLPRELPKFPALKLPDGTGTASTFDEKVGVLAEQFFPPAPEVDLSDIDPTTYPPELRGGQSVAESEVRSAITRPKPDRAPGPDGIPNRFLKIVTGPFLKPINALFKACMEQSYHPRSFREANTIVLKKPGKPDHTVAKAYRPIALLNTLGKALESIMAVRLSDWAETHNLLPKEQMGARRNRSTETALRLLTESIFTAWSCGKVASMLSLDGTGAFDRVNHPRLMYDLRIKGIPAWFVKWVESFVSERKTTVTINRTTSAPLEVQAGIPQGSPISPILYLFFNAPLLEACSRTNLKASVGGFVDDVHLLAYGSSTEENCQTLGLLHQRCLEYARRHGASFSFEKYELIHFTRQPQHFNTEIGITIEGVTLAPKPDIRVLGLQIDTQLHWGAQLTKVEEKMQRQAAALTRVTASAWGSTLRKSRQVYTAIVRPAMMYGSNIWHRFDKGKVNHQIIKTLTNQQNRCLRVVAGAYKATAQRDLEAETFIPPIELHLDGLLVHSTCRTNSDVARVIEDATAKIRHRARGTRGRPRKRKPTPTEIKSNWAKEILSEAKDRQERVQDQGRRRRLPAPLSEWALLKKWRKWKWEDRWRAQKDRDRGRETPARKDPPSGQRLKLHDNLRRAESSLSVQMRTGKIGLAQFLYSRKVPGVESPHCSCGGFAQTTTHILQFCTNFDDIRPQLHENAGTKDVKAMLTCARGLRAASKWMMQTNLLKQYSLARQQLYGELIIDEDDGGYVEQ
jgi:endonuclease/exonuclease/phosphatase family metal-dependent hydrolase